MKKERVIYPSPVSWTCQPALQGKLKAGSVKIFYKNKRINLLLTVPAKRGAADNRSNTKEARL